MNSATQNLLVSVVAMQVARKIPFDDPQVLTYVRIAYVVTQIVVLGVYYYVSAKIRAKNDQTVLKYVCQPNGTTSPSSAPSDLNTFPLAYTTSPPLSQTKEPGNLVVTTNRDYDLGEVSKLVRGAYIGIAMMVFLHGYMKYTQPLFIQALMGLKNLYDAKPVAIWLLGKPAEGDLKRPFKAGGGLFGMPGAEPQTDKAAIDEAEKRIGKKEE
ncbi:hypothetical protein EIP86_000682 [Pleurotus ostreatoroseus]|nr:hypothetical protein EIP86_000682 [Pleurotus ostreatoroseus]